jgi:hypothetical protein
MDFEHFSNGGIVNRLHELSIFGVLKLDEQGNGRRLRVYSVDKFN